MIDYKHFMHELKQSCNSLLPYTIDPLLGGLGPFVIHHFLQAIQAYSLTFDCFPSHWSKLIEDLMVFWCLEYHLIGTQLRTSHSCCRTTYNEVSCNITKKEVLAEKQDLPSCDYACWCLTAGKTLHAIVAKFLPISVWSFKMAPITTWFRIGNNFGL